MTALATTVLDRLTRVYGAAADTDRARTMAAYLRDQFPFLGIGATALAGHRDFFIRKAIGWALREYAKTDPAAVLSYVEAHCDRLSPLSVREALKNIR